MTHARTATVNGMPSPNYQSAAATLESLETQESKTAFDTPERRLRAATVDAILALVDQGREQVEQTAQLTQAVKSLTTAITDAATLLREQIRALDRH